MTVTAEQIKIAKDHGMREVDLIARCCNETGVRFYIALAMLEKETGTCRNVYGHDAGGALSGFPGAVNKDNYAVFRWLIFTKGQTSNGVGPSQLTFKGFFTDMEGKGLKPYDIHDNISYGIKLIYSYYRDGRDRLNKSVTESLRYAGTRYNGASAYGDRFLDVALKWKERAGSADYA
jgi:hypothetical protein